MDMHFDESLVTNYKSKSQKIRIMSESWICKNMFCPCCGNSNISHLKNNLPVADMQCLNCGEIFELKSKQGKIGNKINDGSYTTMIERITSITNPDLFVMQYSSNYYVTDLLLIPKFFFTHQIIEKRKPLSATAKRAGWTGCNILYSDIPKQGKINIITNGIIKSTNEVVNMYSHIKKLNIQNIDSRGWLMDVIYCINEIENDEFSLKDIYEYAEILKRKHIHNNNIEAKIRQQLQILRDKGFIEFVERGYYRKLLN